MAVVQKKSASITGAEAGVLQNSYNAGGINRSECEVVPVTTGDSIASTARIVRIPSNARLCSIIAFNTANAGTVSIGLAETTANGGAVVSAALFAAALSMAGANTAVGGLTAVAAQNRAKRVWELLGLSADPGRVYDVLLTWSVAVTGDGFVGLEIQYVI